MFRRLLVAFCLALVALLSTVEPAAAVSRPSDVRTPAPLTEELADRLEVIKEASDALQATESRASAQDSGTGAAAGALITGTALTFDAKEISVKTSLAEATDPATHARFVSGEYLLFIQMAFNGSPSADAYLIPGFDQDLGRVAALGQSQYGGFCEAGFSASGADITVTADSSCFYRPGKIAYSVAYGNFEKASRADYSEFDVAPDLGFTEKQGERGGYWLLGKDGGVFSFGDAQFYGSTGNLKLNQPVVAMSAMPDGNGYRFVAADGGVFNYGSARYYGSTGNIRLNQPVVGMATTPTGDGYWLVAGDGGIFSFGDARFYGSTGSLRLNKPIVAMASTPSGHGYWLVAGDGGIFSFGDARFFGSTGSLVLNRPITAMAPDRDGDGYLLLAEDGGVFAFGASRFLGSGSGTIFGSSFAMTTTNAGYRIADTTGGLWQFGENFHHGDLIDLEVWPNSPIIGLAELP